MPQPLDDLARGLRAAVLANHHEKAQRLTEQYTTALREYWLSLPRQERNTSPLPKQSVELLNWAREMTIVQHALTAQHLAAVEKASRYQIARSIYLQSAALDAGR